MQGIIIIQHSTKLRTSSHPGQSCQGRISKGATLFHFSLQQACKYLSSCSPSSSHFFNVLLGTKSASSLTALAETNWVLPWTPLFPAVIVTSYRCKICLVSNSPCTEESSAALPLSSSLLSSLRLTGHKICLVSSSPCREELSTALPMSSTLLSSLHLTGCKFCLISSSPWGEESSAALPVLYPVVIIMSYWARKLPHL